MEEGNRPLHAKMTLLEDFTKALIQMKMVLESHRYHCDFKITVSSQIMLRLLADMQGKGNYQIASEKDRPNYEPLGFSLLGILIESPRLNSGVKYPVMKQGEEDYSL